MRDVAPRRGKTTIAPEVLLTIARLSALAAPGVARLSTVPGGVNRLFQRGVGDGVRIEVKDNAVRVEVYLVVAHDAQVHTVSRTVQSNITRAIHEMVGMDVLGVNVHIDDVAFPAETPAPTA